MKIQLRSRCFAMQFNYPILVVAEENGQVLSKYMVLWVLPSTKLTNVFRLCSLTWRMLPRTRFSV
jgi:hypothetical protein